jgi:AraC-like DNA-binding protein
MIPVFKEYDFKIPFRKVKESHCWQMCDDSLIAREMIKPLFDIGVAAFAITEKKTYTKNLPVNWHRITLVLQGELTIQIGKKRFVHGPGMFSFCPKNEIFQRYAKGPTSWIYINLADIPLWEPLKRHGGYQRQYEWTSLVLNLTSHLFRIYQNPTIAEKLIAVEYSRTLAEILKLELLIPFRNPHKKIEELQSLVSSIRLAPGKDWNVAKMAKMASLSRRSLVRYCLSEYGVSPMDMVIRSRIDFAMNQLLYTDEKVESIARSLNYGTTESFSRIFLKKVGMRPGEFRAKSRSENNGSSNLETENS